MAIYLSIKEVWRNKGRFLLFSMVIALITILVLFVAALGSGLANANRQLIDKLNADLLMVQENVDLNLVSSRVSKIKLNDVLRINGVEDAALLSYAMGTAVFPQQKTQEDVSLVGVEPESLAVPRVIEGYGLRQKYGNEVIIDDKFASSHKLNVGDLLTIRTIQGEEEEFNQLRIVGITEERQYFYARSVILPLYTWDEIRPMANPGQSGQPMGNMIAIRLDEGADINEVRQRLLTYVDKVEVADVETVIQAQPGYAAQQSTVSTQRVFALLIGVLVVGGFFQIQTLQKVPQIGMLKAIGASNRTIGGAALVQIVIVTLLGVFIGGVVVGAAALAMPSTVPIRFDWFTVVTSVTSLLLIGPIGGFVSVRLALRVEPLTAIGLTG